jgi:hypothetical protein
MPVLLFAAAALFLGCSFAAQKNQPKTPEAAKAEVDKTNMSLNQPEWVTNPQSSPNSVVGESDCYVESQLPKENGVMADWFRKEMRRFATSDAIARICLPGVDLSAPNSPRPDANIIGSTPQEYISLCMAGNEVGEKMYLRFDRPQIRCSGAVTNEYSIPFNKR